jgi:hypothetical protein
VIARIWRGTARPGEARDYIDYVRRTGIEHLPNALRSFENVVAQPDGPA